jgi:hypothetical protein
MQQQRENTEPIVTAITCSAFSVKPEKYARQHMKKRWGKYWYATVIPLLVVGVMAIFDWRWLIVGFALVCVVYRMIGVTSWFAQLMRPAAVYGRFPHTVTATQSGDIIIKHYPLHEGDEFAPPTFTIVNEVIMHVSYDNDNVYMDYKYRNEHHHVVIDTLIIPRSAFAGGDSECFAFINLITSARS